jgi:hypothetical protein
LYFFNGGAAAKFKAEGELCVTLLDPPRLPACNVLIPAIEQLRAYLAVSGFVPSLLLVVLCLALLVRVRATPWGLAILALPGTVAHELSHFVVGSVLLAKPSGFSLWPSRSGTGWRLGAVSFRRIGILNGAFVALAPLSLMPLAWLCLLRVSVPAWAGGHRLQWFLAGYLAATLFHGCLPSLTDIRQGGRSLIVYLSVCGLCWISIAALRTWLR